MTQLEQAALIIAEKRHATDAELAPILETRNALQQRRAELEKELTQVRTSFMEAQTKIVKYLAPHAEELLKDS